MLFLLIRRFACFPCKFQTVSFLLSKYLLFVFNFANSLEAISQCSLIVYFNYLVINLHFMHTYYMCRYFAFSSALYFNQGHLSVVQLLLIYYYHISERSYQYLLIFLSSSNLAFFVVWFLLFSAKTFLYRRDVWYFIYLRRRTWLQNSRVYQLERLCKL